MQCKHVKTINYFPRVLRYLVSCQRKHECVNGNLILVMGWNYGGIIVRIFAGTVNIRYYIFIYF